MSGLNLSKRVVKTSTILLVILLILISTPVLAASDRKKPTRPNNFRVTGTTAYSVALAWNPSTDNSGVFSYRIHVSYGQTWTVDQTQTSFNWNFGLIPGNTYSFYIYAVDGAGNQSPTSNTVTASLPLDTTPPTPPLVSLIDVNPTEVSLEWTASTDNGPYLMYQVYVNNVPNVDTGTARSAVVHNLNPETTYNITVRARDLYGGNVSEPSNAVIVTTGAIDPNDTEPPSSPHNLSGLALDCAEVSLSWTESFDNQTQQSAILYDVYVNGIFDDRLLGADSAIIYGTMSGDNVFTVIAIDSAGNASSPANTVVNLC